MSISLLFQSRGAWSLLKASAVILCLISGFALIAGAQTENTIYNFTAFSPFGFVFKNGKLYGTSTTGGANARGAVFELSQVSGQWQQTTLYSFTGGNDGNEPASSVVFDATGNIYGVTQSGGVHGAGVVYKLSQDSSGMWHSTTLYAFTGGADGGYPTGNLVLDNRGNLYGSNVAGGNTTTQNCQNTGGCGVMFRLSPLATGRWAFKALYTFTGGLDGVGPASLTFAKNGILYGSAAGAWQGFELPSSPGLIFTLMPTAYGPWKLNPVYEFKDWKDGGLPGPIIFDDAGNIYGSGAEGGIGPNCLSGYQTNIGCGVVFQLSRNSAGQWAETAIYAFTGGTDGSVPDGGLVFDNGNLYGTTYTGGGPNGGVVFELSPAASGWTESLVYAFQGPDGSNPRSTLATDGAGRLYGVTSYGGTNGVGVAFEIVP